jgi:hypothetical protein
LVFRDIFKKKNLPGKFGIECAKLERKKYNSHYEYMIGLNDDEEFIRNNLLELSERAMGGMFSDMSYKLYLEGYDYKTKEIYDDKLSIVQNKFKEFKFHTHINFIERYIKAAQVILYNADKLFIKDSVIKLTSWAQWFRYGLMKENKKRKMITPNALFFFSGIGGTGKGELLKALQTACDNMEIAAGKVTTSGISGKFVTSDVKKFQLGIIGEAMWQSQRGRDVNIDTINNIIDKIEIDYEVKGKQSVSLKTNLTLIGGTNSRYLNRRFSLIPFNELEVSASLAPPNEIEMAEAWEDLINFCPDPNDAYYDVQVMNQKSPQAASEDILGVYDCFFKGGRLHSSVLSVREIIKKITNKDRESIRDRRFILNAVKQLIELKILNKISPPSNEALIVSKVEVINEEKFENFISVYNPDEAREIKEGRATKEKVISDIIFELYVEPLKEKNENYVMELEAQNQKLKKELEEALKPDTKKFMKQLDVESDIEIYKKILDVINNYNVKKDKPPD